MDSHGALDDYPQTRTTAVCWHPIPGCSRITRPGLRGRPKAVKSKPLSSQVPIPRPVPGLT